MRQINLTLPMPPKELGRNAGECWNWRKLKRLKDTHNVDVFVAAVNSRPDTPFAKCRIDAKAYTTRQMDVDNIVSILKSTIDQLCRMGFIGNDRDVTWGEVVSVYGGKKVIGERRVELRIVETESGKLAKRYDARAAASRA